MIKVITLFDIVDHLGVFKHQIYSVGHLSSGVPRNFVRGGGVQQIQLRTADRQNGDLGR